jgi:hypothetical protein
MGWPSHLPGNLGVWVELLEAGIEPRLPGQHRILPADDAAGRLASARCQHGGEIAGADVLDQRGGDVAVDFCGQAQGKVHVHFP